MQSRAGVMWRGLYGTWVHLSSAFWLTPRKTLQIHCTTVCTINIHPRYFIGSVLIQKKKKKKWLNELNAASNKAQHFLLWSVEKRNACNLLRVLCWNPLKTDVTANLAVSSNAFMTKAIPQDRCHFCNLPSLLWCRWRGGKALESFWGEPWLCNTLYPLKTAQN